MPDVENCDTDSIFVGTLKENFPEISGRVAYMLHSAYRTGRSITVNLDAKNKITLNTKGELSILPKKKISESTGPSVKKKKSPYKRSDFAEGRKGYGKNTAFALLP